MCSGDRKNINNIYRSFQLSAQTNSYIKLQFSTVEFLDYEINAYHTKIIVKLMAPRPWIRALWRIQYGHKENVLNVIKFYFPQQLKIKQMHHLKVYETILIYWTMIQNTNGKIPLIQDYFFEIVIYIFNMIQIRSIWDHSFIRYKTWTISNMILIEFFFINTDKRNEYL